MTAISPACEARDRDPWCGGRPAPGPGSRTARRARGAAERAPSAPASHPAIGRAPARAVASSSAAWRRAWAESPTPRACATARRRARRRRPPPRVPPCAPAAPAGFSRSTAFSTTTCVSANAATCARCVTHSTWCRVPSAGSRRPTAAPASPPIPASTSSNTSVGGASESTTRTASIARESSPPDAARARGRAARPGWRPGGR